MSYNKGRTSPVDIAANAVIITLAAVIAVLLCVYIMKINGVFDKASEQDIVPHVIGAENITVPPVTAAEPVTELVTEPPVEETEPEITFVTEVYDPAFFENVFVIGDSLSTGFINYEYLKPENVFAQAGITPSSVMTTAINGETALQKVSAFAPEYICIMLGTNGLSYLEADYMADKMSHFIDELKESCPDSEVLIVSIPPVTAEREIDKPEKMEAILKYNSRIKELAEEKSVMFVDSFSRLCNEEGYLADAYAETDGLHLKIHAYPVILGSVKSAITGTDVVYETGSHTTVTEASETAENN